MRFPKFVLAALFATTASLAAPTSAQAEPTLSQILTSLYPLHTSQSLIGTATFGAGGGAGDPATSALFQTFTGTQNGSFGMQVKFAGNNSTFGFFNPPASTTASAPGAADFNAVFTVVGSNGWDGTNVTGSTTVLSHVSAGSAVADAGGLHTITANTSSPATITVNNAGDIFGQNIAMGLRSPAVVNSTTVGSQVSTAGSEQFSSVNSHNSDGLRHMVTYILSGAGVEDKIVIAWEDLPSNATNADWDYNDLVIELVQGPDGGIVPQPEPTTMALLGIGFAGLCGRSVRRRLAARRNEV